MQFIVIGVMLIMYGTFHAIAVDRCLFKLGTRLALVGTALAVFGHNIERKNHMPVQCKAPEKSEEARFVPAVCEIVYESA